MPKTSTIDNASLRVRYLALRATKSLVQRARAVGRPRAAKRVTFIGGIQRSGTNMITAALELSFLTDVFRESDPRAYESFQLKPLSTLKEVIAKSPAPFVVLKALCELQDLGAMLDEFKPAKIIWMVRRYGDMINSHVRFWPGCAKTLGKMVEDPLSAAWRGRGMSDATRTILARHHRPDMGDASAVALFWYIRNVLFFEQNFDTDPRVIVVRYETLVQNPEPQMHRLFDFLELPLGPRIMKDVFASSIGREAAPEIDPEIRALCDGLVQRFEPLIGG